MPNHSEAIRFLQAVFGSDYASRGIFANLNPPAHTRDVCNLDIARDCYWSIAAFACDGSVVRQLSRAKEVRALVIDDVGSKIAPRMVQLGLGEPTAIVETSLGNFQWVYRLAQPVPVVVWGGFFDAVERLIGTKLEGRDAVHLFRLPIGVNSKKRRNGFAVRLTQLNPGIELSGIVPAEISSGTSAAPATGSEPRVRDMLALARLLPNEASVSRAEWVERAHQFKALALDEGKGREAFELWSQKHASYDAAETARVWDSLPEQLRTAGLETLRDAEAADPAAFAQIRNADARVIFDDGEAFAAAKPKSKGITATPFKLIDPAKIPPRDWLYGRILIRKFISMTVAPGGVGKSSLIAVEALAQVTGRDLLGERPAGALRSWLWNLEDPHEETQRKLQAAALHYGITAGDIGDRLFVDSGRDQRLVVAQMNGNGGPMIVRPVIKDLVEQIRLRGIDIVVVDPFVSCHEVSENDNMAQDMVVKEWGRVAELGGCAVHLVDHTRKAPAGTEVNTESSRGAKAKTDAARVVRVINRMTDGQSRPWGVINPWRYFSTFNDKANMAPPVDRRDWFYLESVPLGNGAGAAGAFSVSAGVVQGDDVGVVRRWLPPSSQDMVTGDNFKALAEIMGTGEWLKAPQAGEKWIGNALASVLQIDAKNAKDRKTIKEVLEQWFKAGLLKEVMQPDENRMMRKFIKIAGGF